MPHPPISTLFPYTTLFRSLNSDRLRRDRSGRECLPTGCPPVYAAGRQSAPTRPGRSEEHTSELQSHHDLVCRLLLEKKQPRSPPRSHPPPQPAPPVHHLES